MPPASESRTSPAALIGRGMAAQAAGDSRLARSLYQRVLAGDPHHVDALQLLGTLAYAAGDYAGCIDWTDRALALAAHPVLLANRGMACDALGRLDAAAESYRRALALQPAAAGLHERLGDVLLRAGDHDGAIAAYTDALRCDPALLDALLGLATALRLVGRLSEAATAAMRALALAPESADAQLALGAVHYDAGDLAAARDCIERAVALDPGSRPAQQNLACVLSESGEAEAAVAAFRRAAELAGDDAEAAAELGVALLRNGRHEDAGRCFERALALDPRHCVARHFLAAARGVAAPRAAPDYVRELYDQYANRFDAHLTRQLDYRTPELIAARLRALPSLPLPGDILDLGAGTGLMGLQLRALARTLSGVDLSAQMLERAARRGIYDRLENADLLDHVAAAAAASLDLVVAADVFIYLGDLAAVFAQVRRLLRPGGLFAFSLESAPDAGPPYRLGEHGRYQHARGYVEALAVDHGFARIDLQGAVLRQENARPVEGWIVVLG